MAKKYVPGRGDVVWINFDPASGHEQGGSRPALVVSPEYYNSKVGLMLACPITSRIKGYPFEVRLRAGSVDGAILSDQIRSMDWRSRAVRYAARAGDEVVLEVEQRILILVRG